jgi:tetratricopeptide (TPR) repeat protein
VEPRAHAPAHGRLGRIAGSFDADPAAAARHFEHALTLEPANTDIISNAAGLAASLGRLDTAIALYEYANARDPLNAIGHANLAIAYLNAGRLDEAIANGRTALRLAPEPGGRSDAGRS